MKSVGWRFFCLIAFPLALGLAEEAVPSDDLKTVDDYVDIRKKETSRSGAISESADVSESAEVNPNAEAEELSKTTDVTEITSSNELSDTKRFMTGNFKYGGIPQNNLNYQQLLGEEQFPDQNEYNYAPNHSPNVQNANQIITLNGAPSSDVSASQVVMSRPNGVHTLRSGTDEDDNEKKQDGVESSESYSRVIPFNERILLHKIPGANNLITCSREGELHNFWSSAYQCLVCACIRDTGVLRPVCASCAGCMAQTPTIYPEVDIPSSPGSLVTTDIPLIEEVTCRPLPTGQPFENPLHPCQVCICIESVNIYGKPDVHIKCEENPQCVLPTDATILPPIPDVPVSSPYCDKFPLNVLFPHPSDSCKTCRCSVQVSQLGVPEKQITCLPNPDCTPNPVIITEQPEPYPNLPIPEPVPVYEVDVNIPEPSPWTPATVLPPHLGPLPGPSPHDSCRPYLPNQPFQHPWDECQMCVCTEAFAKKHVTVEINCFTKKSCCVEPPFDLITSATLPPPKQSGKLTIQDEICEYKTFGVEFTHPKDLCSVCTCELQGHVITPFCKRSPKPECQLVAYATITPAFGDVILDNNKLSLPGSTNVYNAASSSQNKAIKNAFVSNGLHSTGSTQTSADQHETSYNQWNLQNLQRPGDFRPKKVQIQGSLPFGSLNYERPDSQLVYGSQNRLRPGNPQYGYGSYGNAQGMGYSQFNPGQIGYPNKAYSQAKYAGSGYSNHGLGHLGYQPGLSRPSEVITQAQNSATASATASAAATGIQSNYAYGPGYQYPGGQALGYQGVKNLAKIQQQQFAQSSASSSQAQASSLTAVKYRGRSGTTDDNEPEDKEN